MSAHKERLERALTLGWFAAQVNGINSATQILDTSIVDSAAAAAEAAFAAVGIVLSMGSVSCETSQSEMAIHNFWNL